MSSPPASPIAPRAVCLEKKAGQFVFIQSHLRSHFGEMKREKPASRARRAGCSPVPGGALGGGATLPPSLISHPLLHQPFPTFSPSPLPFTLLLSLPLPCPLSSLSPTPAVPQPHSPASRPGRAHLHGRHTRGPSAEAQLNAGGGGGRPKLAFPRPSGASSGRGRTKGAGRGERRVCRGIDLQMRLCLRIKPRWTPDPGLRPHRGPRRPWPDPAPRGP